MGPKTKYLVQIFRCEARLNIVLSKSASCRQGNLYRETICNEGAQMDSLFHGPNSIDYYSTIFLLGVSLWGTWSSLPHGQRTESIVVTRLNLEMKAWHLGRPRGLTVMDQLSSVFKMQKGDVSFRLTAEVKHKPASPCSDLSPAMSTVPSSLTCQSPLCPLTHSPPRVTADPGRGLEFWHVYIIH